MGKLEDLKPNTEVMMLFGVVAALILLYRIEQNTRLTQRYVFRAKSGITSIETEDGPHPLDVRDSSDVSEDSAETSGGQTEADDDDADDDAEEVVIQEDETDGEGN